MATYVLDKKTGKLRPARPGDIRKRDSKDFRSMNLGCATHQVDEFNRDFEHTGVRFEHGSGDAIIPDRAAKKRLLKARGYVDYDEVW